MTTTKSICKYKTDFHSHSELRFEVLKFQCDEEALESGYCIFHDDEYFANNSEVLIAQIYEKIKKAGSEPKSLYCIGYHIPAIELTGEILGDAFFSYAIFHDEVTFQDLHFHKNVDFAFARFLKSVTIHYTTFLEANFDNSSFVDKVSIMRCRFGGFARFSDTSFNELSFMESEFKDTALFGHASILYGFFKDLDFGNNAVFSHSELGDVALADCNFHGIFAVVNIQSYGHFDMLRCKTFNEIRLWHSRFFNKCKFESGDFGGKGNFDRSNFEDDASFNESYFNFANFGNTVFRRTASFVRSRFSEAIFHETEFNELTSFKYAHFEDGKKIQFDLVDLSNISFSNCDISRVRFSERVLFGIQNNRYKILDDRQLEDNVSAVDIRDVSSIYRFLRENYEYRLRYEDAGQFFIREMELRRNYSTRYSNGVRLVDKKNPISKFFSFTSAYKYLCNYGEDFRLPILWILALFTLSSLFWFEILQQSATGVEAGAGHVWISSISRTLSDIFQVRTEDLSPADYIIRILSIPILGTLFVSLRRKFERRFRH